MSALANRRTFLQAAAALGGAATTLDGKSGKTPALGIVVHMDESESADKALAKVRRLGFSSCQLFVGLTPVSEAAAIQKAAETNGVTITAMMTLGKGPFAWTLRDGPKTVGIVPRATRAERVAALKQASDLAKRCHVGAVHTHCGFIPEDPADPLYREAVAAIKDVAQHCEANGQMMLCETGQETPITLLRAIQDCGQQNVFVNLDLANLILYGKGDPIGALDVLGPRVRGMHAKDGLYPTDPYGLGEEVPIGSGMVNFPEVVKRLAKLNYRGPITIEREISGAQQEADLRKSQTYLEGLIQTLYA